MIFLIVGAPTGGMALGLAVFGERAMTGGGSEAGELLWGLLMSGLAGYVYGSIPATITGLVAAHYSDRIRRTPSWLGMATGVGAAVTGLLSLVGCPGLPLLLSPLGALAAFVSALVALRVRPLGGGVRADAGEVTPETAG